MLPTQEEQDAKLIEILKTDKQLWHTPLTDAEYERSVTFDILQGEKVFGIVAKSFAKWYAERVIEHCAEVAKVDRDFIDWKDKDIIDTYEYTSQEEDGDSYGYEVNKQSILKVKDEL